MKNAALLVGLIVALATAPTQAAPVPSTISFTGRLSTSGGPVNGSASVTFNLFPTVTGGSSLWTETHAVTAANGLVYIELGSMTTFDATDLDGSTRFFELTVNGEVLTPRLPVNSVPYAMRADVANSAELLGTIAPGDVVTGVTGGGGVNASKSANTVTLSVDTSVLQSRVTGTCAAGSSIASINPNGTVTCETDDGLTTEVDAVIGNEVTNTGNTSLTRAGSGTGADPYTLTVNTAVIQSRVTGTCGPNASIASISATGSVTCETDDGIAAEVDGIIGNEITNAGNTSLTRGGTGSGIDPYTLTVNTAVIQSRVTGVCGPNASIASINANGSVTCETDDGITTEVDGDIGNEIIDTADTSLIRSGTGTAADPYKLAANPTVVQARVSNFCAAGSSIRVISATGAVTCESDTAGPIVTVTVQSTLPANQFTTAIAACPVTHPKALGGGVDSDNVLNHYVTTSGPTLNGQQRMLAVGNGTFGAPDGWYAGIYNNSATSGFIRVGVICSK